MSAITDEQLSVWAELAKRDDWHFSFCGSDIRQLIGEVRSNRAAAASGIETEGQDAQRLGAKHESPTAESGDAPTSNPISPSITRR